jgi:hypothetical protein
MMNGERLGVRLNPPKAGEQTQEILAELGYRQDEIDELVSGGIVNHASTS